MSKTALTFTTSIQLNKFDNSNIVMSSENIETIRKQIQTALESLANSGVLTCSDTNDTVPITASVQGVIHNS